jgi:hypothetical protein
MITNPWHYDPCVKVLLSASMLKCAGSEDAEGDSLLLPGDYGRIETVAELATRLLPGYCYEGDRWDGCVWIEILEASEPDSLAYWLTLLAGDDTKTAWGLEDAVVTVLQRWLVENERGLRLEAQSRTF